MRVDQSKIVVKIIALLLFLSVGLTSCMITYRVHQWNLLVYMAADNNLEPYAIENINAMEYAMPSPYVNVFVLVDRTPGYDSSGGDWTTTRLYKINWDLDLNVIRSQLIEDYGELDMTLPATLTNFIVRCNQLSPADHTLLTLWGHGAGVYPRSAGVVSETASSTTETDPLTRGICPDDTTGPNSFLTTDEVRQALADARTATGKKIDIINMDACSMQMLEIAYEWRGEADYLVGSEAFSPAEGNNYFSLLKSLNSGPVSARDAAIAIVDSWYDWYSTSGYDRTYSAVSLGTPFDQLATDFQTFASTLNSVASGVTQNEIVTSRQYALSFPSSASPSGFMDLGSFCEQLLAYVGDSAVTDAAAALLADINSAVIRNAATNNYSGSAHGISILLPVNSSDWSTFIPPNAQYPSFQICNDTEWNEFIVKFITW